MLVFPITHFKRTGGMPFNLADLGGFEASFNVNSDDVNPQDVAWGDSGNQLYVMGGNTENILRYPASTAFDIATTSTPAAGPFNVNSEQTNPQDVFWQDDGSSVFICGHQNNAVHRYPVGAGTNWLVETFDGLITSATGLEESNPKGLFIGDSGNKLYIVGIGDGTIYQYNLSSAWDISSASSPADESFDVSGQPSSPHGLFWKDDGTKVYHINNDGIAYQYPVSTAWSLFGLVDTTTTPAEATFDTSNESGDVRGMAWSDDGLKFYMMGGDDTVYQYPIE